MSEGTVVRPLGPFSLAAARDFATHWEPLPNDDVAADSMTLGFRLDGDFTAVAATVAPAETGDDVRVQVAGTSRTKAAVAQVSRMLSLDVDATTYPQIGKQQPEIGRLMTQLPGLRPVLFASPYEAAAWGVLAQRISLRQAAGIQSRLAASHGDVVDIGGRGVPVFPHPEKLVDATEIPGVPPVKVDRLRGIARAALDGNLDVDRLRLLGPEGAINDLQRLPGIGPFWASLIYLRATGVVDNFPGEPNALAALRAVYGLDDDVPSETIADLVTRFAPWRMWVGVLLRVAAGRGLVPGVVGR